MLDAAPPVAAAAFWKAQGLRTMTANALDAAGIHSLDALMALDRHSLERIYSIGNKGVAEIQEMLLRRTTAEASPPSPLARSSDAALVMELIRRGYRIDRPPNA